MHENQSPNELRLGFVNLADQADPADGVQRVATAQVATPKASRYLKALCNHFDRKAEARYDDNRGFMNSRRFFNGRIWPIVLLIMLLLAACTTPTEEAAETDVSTTETETEAEEPAEEPAEESIEEEAEAELETAAEPGEETAAADASPLPRTVTDVNGEEVVIEDDSAVVALDGPLTEIVYALGAEDRLVATDVSSVYPEAATQLPQVGYVRSLSAEPVLAMAPTLILTTDSAGPPEALAQLQESGVTIAVFKAPETIEDSFALMRSVAAALGKEAEGEEIVAQMEADLAEAADLLAQTEGTPRVMFIYARGLDTVSAAGYGTSVDVMFELAGVENAITEWEGYQPLTAEGAVTAAPDALLLFTSGLESVGGSEGLLGVPGIAETPAGAEGRIYDMDGLLLTGLGPRVGQAVIQLIQMFHAEVAP
jgi:iron complex transport system substrate-binding protein